MKEQSKGVLIAWLIVIGVILLVGFVLGPVPAAFEGMRGR